MATKEKDILEPSLDVLGIPAYKQKKTEEYMSAKMLEHFRSILMALRQRILEGGDKIVTHMKEEAINYPDPNDRASQEEDFRLELRTRDRERKLLKKIEESLELVREKDYGYCEVCGVEIGLRRLEARPTATLCIDCKTLDEIREKQQKQEEAEKDIWGFLGRRNERLEFAYYISRIDDRSLELLMSESQHKVIDDGFTTLKCVGKLNGQSLELMLDTGATASLIRTSLLRKLPDSQTLVLKPNNGSSNYLKRKY
mgnify:CR=1 FL=1